MSTATANRFALQQPVNVPISDKFYQLIWDYAYHWEHQKNHYCLTVPVGFKYDGASVPRICWTLTGLRPDGLIRAAATVHDFIYLHQGRLPVGAVTRENHQFNPINISQGWTRKQADLLFARMMREAGVSKIQRRLAYLSVRIFGGFYWNS